VKYFLIAGELSGDQHAGRLMQALREKDQEAEFQFLGGDNMSQFGGKPIVHIKEMAFMGFTKVLANLGKIRINFQKARHAIIKFYPDVIIFVDYPGFNLRMAKWAKSRGYSTHYYIAPAVWAWNTRRVYKLKKYCDRLYSILPFEKDFFKKYGLDVDYVGNPVYEDIERIQADLPDVNPTESRKIALLPGSRRQEIQRVLPEMLAVIDHFEEYEFVIAAMDSHKALYDSLIPKDCRVSLEYNRPLEILNESAAALVTSGTATLETALMGIPQIVCYKAGHLSYLIAKSLIKVEYISLVNLILNGPAIPELIQGNLKSEYIIDCLKSILPGGPNHEDQLEISDLVREKLGDAKVSNVLAELITSRLNSLG